MRSPQFIVVALTCAVALGCKGEKATPTENSAQSSAPSAAPSTPPATSPAAGPSPHARPLGNPKTIGYPMPVLPGQGLGPIRFGSNFESVARHMTRPCDDRTETRCLYVDQAVDFTMKDGVVDGIYVVRRDRPAPPAKDGSPRYFGTYFGALLPDISLGVHKHIVEEELRAPDKVEKLSEPLDQNGTVERHYYDGLILEYDRLPNGNVVLGAMRVLPSKTATNPYQRPSTSDKLGLPPEPPPRPKAAPGTPGAGIDFLNPDAKSPASSPQPEK